MLFLFFHSWFLFCQPRLEFLYPSSSVNEFLLACVERVALRANFNINPLFCGSDGEFVAAGAFNRGFVVFWMDVCFHLIRNLPV